MEMSVGEKLVALMLCDLFEHLKVRSQIDPTRVRSAISAGHIWGVKEQLGGLIASEDSSPELRKEVADILWMWSYLEDAFDRLDATGRAELERLAPHSTPVRFHGFDGNHEGDFISIARWLIADDDFHGGKFRDRALNAHHPTIANHRRMYQRFMMKVEDPSRDYGQRLMDAVELADVIVGPGPRD